MLPIFCLYLFLPATSALEGIHAYSVSKHSLHPCATCCDGGPSNSACEFSFDGESGVCCGAIAARYFCCPSHTNSTCATEGSDATYSCRHRSQGASFPALVFSSTALLLILGAVCLVANTLDAPVAAAIRKAEYQQLCGHPNGYPSPFGAETPMRELGRPAAGTPYQEEPAGV
jgi:hypothetical protein